MPLYNCFFFLVSPEHPSTTFSDLDKQTPTPVDDSPRAGLPHTDSGIGEEGHVAGSLNGSEMGLGLGLGLVGRETDRDRDGGVGGGTDLLCSLSDVRRSQESLLDSPHNPNSSQAPPLSISSISQTSKGINVKVSLNDPHLVLLLLSRLNISMYTSHQIPHVICNVIVSNSVFWYPL